MLTRLDLLAAATAATAAGAVGALGFSMLSLGLPAALFVALFADGIVRPRSSVLYPTLSHGPRNGKRVALSFDDGPDPEVTPAVLDALAKHGARATFFTIGRSLESHPQLGRRLLLEGHELGNHTMHHLDIAAMEASGAYAEIAGCAQRLRALTGSAGRWFRPSQTRYSTPLIEREARKAGYQTCVSYDVDSLDYTDPGPDAIVSTVLGSTRPGSIVSLHLGHSGTVIALPAILRGLASRGLRPVTLTDLLSP